ncbi:MAG: hypothetical protein WC222_02995 [Parachlamydiales bacterium]
MKLFRHIACLVTLSILTVSSLQAAIEDQSIADESLINPEKLHPFTLEGSSDLVGKSSLSKNHFEDEDLHYGQSNVTLNATFYYDKELVEGAQATIGYSHTLFDWVSNPYFSQRNWDTLTIGINGFTGRCSKWFWQGRLAANIDMDHWDLTYYTTYDMMLWGRYDIHCNNIGLHFGLLAQTGMRMDRVYPILGFDWTINPTWKINAIFPLNVSAVYTYDCCWNAGVGGRFFDTRHRTGDDQPLPMGIFAYRTIGAEAFINYSNCDWAEANFHAGWLISGKVKISNRHQENGKWFEVGSAPYVGAKFVLKY